jgi:predicted nucleic acid-binding protein
MDRLFLDTNIVLDLLAKRSPFDHPAKEIVSLADMGKVEIIVSALTFANSFYILSKYVHSKTAIEEIKKFKILTQTSDLTDRILEKGLESSFPDFEDSLQYHSAISGNCSHIISRNGKHFKSSVLPVMTADEYLSSINLI